MRQRISTINRHFTFGLLLLALAAWGCKKSDNFYQKLIGLPQIDNSKAYSYKASYVVGETMVIAGNLDPDNGLEISIGGQKAAISKIDTFRYDASDPGVLQKVSIIITDAMVGKSREVKVITKGGMITGASIDVYSQGGAGSFTGFLTNAPVATFTTNSNVFLHCINGKGDVYYYGSADKKLYHITKDGTQTELYDLSLPANTGGLTLTNFVAGGVNPQGTLLFLSAQTATGYAFGKIDLQNKTFTVLNQSAALSAPYEGTIASVSLVVSGIYPDSNGNVYLAIGINPSGLPDAIATYTGSTGRVSYILNKLYASNAYADMPGSATVSNFRLGELRFSPEEGLLYTIYEMETPDGKVIQLYDLNARVRLYSFNSTNTTNSLDVVGPLSSLSISLYSNNAGNSHGYMPMPGRRLQVLLYQTVKGSASVALANDFPRWVVFDFSEQRSYLYAPGRFRTGSYDFRTLTNALKDELLNYDEDGNLYTTANGRTVLIRTKSL